MSVISGNVTIRGLENFLRAIYWKFDNKTREGAGKLHNYLYKFCLEAKNEVSNVILLNLLLKYSLKCKNNQIESFERGIYAI